MNDRSALILGATGLVGNALLRRLLATDRYSSVRVLVRREINFVHEKLAQHIVDFERLEDYRGLFAVDDVFCCLGSTMAKSKTREAFRRVDYDYPVAAARLAREAGARQYLVVSALGASPGSKIFYNRVKGEAERDIAAAGFRAVHIFRPSLLLGERAEKRPGENFMQKAVPLMKLVMRGPLKKYFPVRAETVAAAMAEMAVRDEPGVHIHESSRLKILAAP